MKKVLLVLILLFSAISLISCGEEQIGGENGSITISYYKGGTGSAWIEAIADAFARETGIAVELDDDNSITVNARTQLQAGRNLSDIMFIRSSRYGVYQIGTKDYYHIRWRSTKN